MESRRVYKDTYERILSARERLIELRDQRFDELAQLRMFLRVKLNDYLSNRDPITGATLASIAYEGNRIQGEAVLRLGLYDGSFVKITLDRLGHFQTEAEPNVFDGIRLIDLHVSGDVYSADFDFARTDVGSAEIRRADFGKVLEVLFLRTADQAEREAGSAPAKTLVRLLTERGTAPSEEPVAAKRR
ncbi:MAG: hypothetical protein ACREM6_11355 [Vulcanimicrobiaceae bacterium]